MSHQFFITTGEAAATGNNYHRDEGGDESTMTAATTTTTTLPMEHSQADPLGLDLDNGGFQEIFNDLLFDGNDPSAYNTPSDVFQSPSGMESFDYSGGGAGTTPSELFSPLTSPLLEGVNSNTPPALPNNSSRPSAQQQVPSQSGNGGSSRNRNNKSTTPVMGPSRVSKVSPMIKPKMPSSSGPTARKSSLDQQDSLPDISMPPPSSGSSSRRTSTSSLSSTTSTSAPATPATLMNLRQQQPQQNTNGKAIIYPDDKLLRANSNKNKSNNSSRRTSPAIRPKISPAASPNLGPTTTATTTTTTTNNNNTPAVTATNNNGDLAALLSSKSNYQTIVEGKHNELGLSYPEHLSANLTSKKTNHKLAEQGRRNRMNTAVNDLAKLVLPEGASSSSTTSKAHTVESAIDYIRSLKQELEETKHELERYKDNTS